KLLYILYRHFQAMAITAAKTHEAPASRNAWAQVPKVAPVVTTSSTNRMLRPLTADGSGTLIEFSRLISLSSLDDRLWGFVCLVLANTPSTGIFIISPRACPILSDWL